MLNKLPYNEKLIDQISSVNFNKEPIYKILMEVLDISTDAAYARIKGKVSFTLEEALKLAEHFKISIDDLRTAEVNTAIFRYNGFYGKNVKAFDNYLKQMVFALGSLLKVNGTITYLCQDITFLECFRFPVLARFKIWYWLYEVLKLDDVPPVFTHDIDFGYDIEKSIKEINEIYAQLDRTEIWTPQAFESLLLQIDYALSCGDLEDMTTFEKLNDNLIELLTSTEESIEKFKPKKVLKLYWCAAQISNNTVILEYKHQRLIYLGFNNFNSLVSNQKSFSAEIDQWVESIIAKSTNLSGVNRKDRKRFFKLLDNLRIKYQGRGLEFLGT